MNNVNEIWNKLSFYFLNNDGSLPEIAIKNISEGESIKIFELLLGSSNQLSEDNKVWVNDKELNCNDFEDSISLFHALKNDSRHILLNGIKVNQENIPPLGCTIFENEIELDYRMGTEWSCNSLKALILLFKKIKCVAPNVTFIMPKDGEAPFLEDDIDSFNDIINNAVNS